MGIIIEHLKLTAQNNYYPGSQSNNLNKLGSRIKKGGKVYV